MRHNKKFNHLSRKSAHRKAMLSNMACSLIAHKRIATTVPKAKALRVYVEPILNKSKEDTTHSRRQVFALLQNKEAVTELFRDISVKIADRPGGYTRILRTGFRLGDNAEMCIIELVDYNENMLKEKVAKKTRRTRRAGGTKAETTASAKEKPVKAEETAPAVEEAPKADETVEAVVEATPQTEEVVETVEEVAAVEETPAPAEEAPKAAETPAEEAPAAEAAETPVEEEKPKTE
jgi:large subunit ribosomal protein L17